MIVPLVLFVMSGVAVAVVLALPGLSDLVLLAGPCLLASLFLLLRAGWRRRKPTSQHRVDVDDSARPAKPWVPDQRPGFSPFRRAASRPKWILVDGSNVLYWKDGTPQLEALRAVLEHLTARGYTPGVVFDANAGYLISGSYRHHAAMGALVGLPEDRVMVVGKGSPADTVLLQAARDLGARIVTNDRYRDWADAHPEVGTPGHLVKGGFRDTGLWLDLAESAGK